MLEAEYGCLGDSGSFHVPIKNMPVKSIDRATEAAYLWAGMVTGILDIESTKAWASSVIEELDAPPIDIIEVATAGGQIESIAALQAAARGGDLLQAGAWLFADVLEQLNLGALSVHEAIKVSLRVARVTHAPEGCLHAFAGLDDELQLVIGNVYGSLGQVEARLVETLARYT